jgi:hypothetical protein
MKNLSYLVPPNSVDITYNFGPIITLYNNFPPNYTFPDGTYDVVLKQKNSIFDQYYLKPAHWFRNFAEYYIPLDIEIYGLDNQEMVLLYTHKFDLNKKDVLFELHPEDEIESKIWLDYLTIFQSKTKCNIFIKNILDTPHKFASYNPENLFYASYRINRDENIYVNPFGNKCNSFDLINNKLLRV